MIQLALRGLRSLARIIVDIGLSELAELEQERETGPPVSPPVATAPALSADAQPKPGVDLLDLSLAGVFGQLEKLESAKGDAAPAAPDDGPKGAA